MNAPPPAGSVPAASAFGLDTVITLASLGCLVAAVQLERSRHLPLAFFLLAGAIALVALATLGILGESQRRGVTAAVRIAGAGLVVFQFVAFFSDWPAAELRHLGLHGLNPFYMGLIAAAVVAGSRLAGQPWFERAGAVLLVALFVLLGIWIFRSSPNPQIDVILFQRDGPAALLKGENPYALTFPNIYGEGTPFYGRGLTSQGRLNVGFPYPPLSLLGVLPAQVLAGDFRYAHLAALAVTALLMIAMVPRGLGVLAAILLLFTPRVFFVLEQGWTEPLVVVLVAGVVFCAHRAPRLLPYAFGLLLASKQYLLLAAPLVLLLWEEGTDFGKARFLLKAAAVALVPVVPFVLWDPGAFLQSTVVFHFRQPFRPDALSFLAWWSNVRGAHPPAVLGFVAALVATGVSLLRLKPSPRSFALALSLVLLCFFAFNKQAATNYYFLVIGALCIALAATPVRSVEGRSS